MTATDVQIRQFSGRDSLEELTALLHTAYAPLAVMGLNYTAVDQPLEITRQRVAQGTCFVAVQDRKLVGTVLVRGPQDDSASTWYRRPQVAIAGQLAVTPDLQRHGLGSALLEESEAWAREQGFRELSLDTADSATHLLDFYRHRGFRAVEHVQWPGKQYRTVILSKALQ